MAINLHTLGGPGWEIVQHLDQFRPLQCPAALRVVDDNKAFSEELGDLVSDMFSLGCRRAYKKFGSCTVF